MRRYFWQLILNLLLASAPLLTASGRNLEYEYTLMLSVAIILIWPLLPLINQQRMQEQIMRRGHSGSAVEIWWILLFGPLSLLIPGLVLFTSKICQCSKNGYLLWMIIQTYPAWILSQALYHLMWRGRLLGKQKLELASGFGLILSLDLVLVTSKLWFAPQKRTVDLFLGFLHGPIYDQFIELDHGIILSRVSHVCIGAMLLIVAWYQRKRFSHVSMLFAVFAWLASAYGANQYQSSIHSTKALQTQLSETLRNEDIILHYDKKSAKNVKALFKQASFHCRELKAQLAVSMKPVDIYLYSSQSSKKLLFGAGSTDVADVYTPSIHISNRPGWHPTLRHELAHAVSSKFAFHGLGFHPNLAFKEGLAVALSPKKSALTLSEQSASLFGTKRLPNMNQLFSPLFWNQPGRQSYVVSGSIVEFILKTSGVDALKKLYAGQSWTTSLGKTKKETLLAWKADILRSTNRSKLDLYADSLFRKPAVFYDICPHSKADFAHKRAGVIYNRLRQPLGWDPHTDYWPWRLSINNKDHSARIAWWNSQIKEAIQNPPNSKGRLQTWVSTLSSARQWPPESIEDIQMAIMQSDLLHILNRHKESMTILATLDAFGRQKALGNSLERQILTRIMLSQINNSDLDLAWRKALAGWDQASPKSPRIQNPWIISYLDIRNRLRKGQNIDLSSDWLNLKLPKNLPRTFYEEWFESLSDTYIMLEDYASAETAMHRAQQSGLQQNLAYFAMRKRFIDFVDSTY